LKSLNLSIAVFAADTLLYDVTLTFDLEHLQHIVFDEIKLCTKFNALISPRRSYCDFSIWPNDLERRVACCARLWDNFHQFWPSTTYPCL